MGLKYDFSKFTDKLENIEKKIQKEICEESLNAGADVILNEMLKEENVPYKTGALKESLGKSKVKGSGNNAKINIGPQSDDRSIIERAYYQEYGTERMMGRKWMKKSYDNARDDANKAIEETLAKRIGD